MFLPERVRGARACLSVITVAPRPQGCARRRPEAAPSMQHACSLHRSGNQRRSGISASVASARRRARSGKSRPVRSASAAAYHRGSRRSAPSGQAAPRRGPAPPFRDQGIGQCAARPGGCFTRRTPRSGGLHRAQGLPRLPRGAHRSMHIHTMQMHGNAAMGPPIILPDAAGQAQQPAARRATREGGLIWER